MAWRNRSRLLLFMSSIVALVVINSFGDSMQRDSEGVSFASMVLFPKNNGSRLVQVRALES